MSCRPLEEPDHFFFFLNDTRSNAIARHSAVLPQTRLQPPTFTGVTDTEVRHPRILRRETVVDSRMARASERDAEERSHARHFRIARVAEVSRLACRASSIGSHSRFGGSIRLVCRRLGAEHPALLGS